eukprot:11280161-Alexandrium_andersonii.AAC.1
MTYPNALSLAPLVRSCTGCAWSTAEKDQGRSETGTACQTRPKTEQWQASEQPGANEDRTCLLYTSPSPRD